MKPAPLVLFFIFSISLKPFAQVADKKCEIGGLPSVSFKIKSAFITADSKTNLDKAVGELRNSPWCRVTVTGYCAASKSEQQMSWDRVYSVVNYLEDHGISRDRLIFSYGMEGGDCNVVDLRVAEPEEYGPSEVPVPNPNLSTVLKSGLLLKNTPVKPKPKITNTRKH